MPCQDAMHRCVKLTLQDDVKVRSTEVVRTFGSGLIDAYVALSQSFDRIFHNFISRNLGSVLAKFLEIWGPATQISLRTKFGGVSNETLAQGNAYACAGWVPGRRVPEFLRLSDFLICTIGRI